MTKIFKLIMLWPIQSCDMDIAKMKVNKLGFMDVNLG